MRRSELVRRQKDLMLYFTDAHQNNDNRKKEEVMQEYQRNNEQLKFAKK